MNVQGPPERESGAWRGLRTRTLEAPYEKPKMELEFQEESEAKERVCSGSPKKKGMDGQPQPKWPRAHVEEHVI